MMIHKPPARIKPPDPEHILLAAAWADPVQFACDADRLELHISDFADRLCGTVAGYLRICGESGRLPSLAGAEAVLDSFAVPHEPDEVFFLLIDTPVSRGDSFADLIRAVQRAADDRAEAQCRALARDALRAVRHAFECPRCKSCRTNPRERRFASPRARRIVYARCA